MSSSGKRTYEPDWKPAKRQKNPKVMKSLHIRGVTCVLCGEPGTLHHIYPKGQGGDDVEENLIGLCGSGTTGCHGLITGEDEITRRDLGQYLLLQRPDAISYIISKLGEEAGKAWLARRLLIAL